MKAIATATFFKPYGKYYSEETYEFDNVEDPVYIVFDEIKAHFANYYKGMHMVVTFDDSYDHGYPFMQPASER